MRTGWRPALIEVGRRIGVFFLALVVAAIIMVLITLPLLLGIWWLMRYAAGQ